MDKTRDIVEIENGTFNTFKNQGYHFERKLRTRFDLCLSPDWETLWRSIVAPPQLALGHHTW